MYPIEFQRLISNNILKKPILFFSCISFEDRCSTAGKLLYNSIKDGISFRFFKIIDNYSCFRSICTEKQNKNELEVRAHLNLGDLEVPSFNMIDSFCSLKENVIDFFSSCFCQQDFKTLIFDITTIPKTCYFPFLKWFLEDLQKISIDFLITYTKPRDYGDNYYHSKYLRKKKHASKFGSLIEDFEEEDKYFLESEPELPELLIGDIEEGQKLLWIPSIGFNSQFTSKIWQLLQRMLKNRIINELEVRPLLGFPAFRQDFYDKSIINHMKNILLQGDFTHRLANNNQYYSTADDPFEVYKRIEQIAKEFPRKKLILSPIGPKPMSIGIALAAIIQKLPVIGIQAKSYNPSYSIGEGDSLAYWIKSNQDYTF